MEFAEMRRTMVDCQIVPESVTACRVIDALLDVPREFFVPRQQQHIAYIDDHFPLSHDRFVMRPAVFAKMVQALDPQPHEKALVVGCNLGYSLAVLSQLVHSVVGVEVESLLSQEAKDTLRKVGAKNFEVVLGAHPKGCSGSGPYDLILVEGKLDRDPQDLLVQLKDNGRLVAITSCPGRADEVTLYTKIAGHVSKKPICDGSAPFLKGFEPEEKFVF